MIHCWCCVADLRPRQTAVVMSGRPVNLTTLFLDRLRPPKRLTSTSCTHFRQFLNQRKEKRKCMAGLAPESDALPTALRGPTSMIHVVMSKCIWPSAIWAPELQLPIMLPVLFCFVIQNRK